MLKGGSRQSLPRGYPEPYGHCAEKSYSDYAVDFPSDSELQKLEVLPRKSDLGWGGVAFQILQHIAELDQLKSGKENLK